MGTMHRLSADITSGNKKAKRKAKKLAKRLGASRHHPSPVHPPVKPGPAVQLPAGPFTSIAHKAIRHAARVGLYILIEGPSDDPHWLVYSTVTGIKMLSYYPKTRRWLAVSGSGVVANCHEALQVALEIAARLARNAQKQAKGRG